VGDKLGVPSPMVRVGQSHHERNASAAIVVRRRDGGARLDVGG
jgi:hypothetical protein